jgi:hypothetical protein
MIGAFVSGGPASLDGVFREVAFTNEGIEQKRKVIFYRQVKFCETRMSRARNSARRKDKERKVDYEEDYFVVSHHVDGITCNGYCNDYSDR